MKIPINVKLRWNYGRGIDDSDELHARLSSAASAWIQREMQNVWDRLEEDHGARQMSVSVTVPIVATNVWFEVTLTVKRPPARSRCVVQVRATQAASLEVAR